jgi:hypothetical protein
MRLITLIAKDLIELIPQDADHRFIVLKEKIEKDIIQSAFYSPREMIYSPWFWNKLSMILSDVITYNDYENIPWCKQFIDIFQDPDYKNDDPAYHIPDNDNDNVPPVATAIKNNIRKICTNDDGTTCSYAEMRSRCG